MALADVIQEIEDARVDAQSLEDFIFQPAGVMVERRLAPPVNTLQYYVDYMSNLATGKDGVDGVDAAITSMTVATGAAGTAASVVTGGTPTARTFALTIPRGDKGLDGSFTQKSYTTYAAMDADKVNIPANTSVTITNDTDSTKNGMYAYNGTAFTKSAYDPLTQSKTYTDTAKADTLLKVQNVFATKALMTASTLADGGFALVVDDDYTRNGVYKKESGVWVETNQQDATRQINAMHEARGSFNIINSLGLESFEKSSYISTSGNVVPSAKTKGVFASTYREILADSGDITIRGYGKSPLCLYAFYDMNYDFISYSYGSDEGEQAYTIPSGSIPSNAKYIRYTAYLTPYDSIEGVAPLQAKKRYTQAIVHDVIPELNVNALVEFSNLSVGMKAKTFINHPSGIVANTASIREASSLLTIDKDSEYLHVYGYGNSSVALYALYDVTGKLVFSTAGQTIGMQHAVIPMGDIPDSAVHVRFTGESGKGSFIKGVKYPSLDSLIDSWILSKKLRTLPTDLEAIYIKGASLTDRSNAWFAKATERLGVEGINKAASGSRIVSYSQSFWRGAELTEEQFDKIGVFAFQLAHETNIDDTADLKDSPDEYTADFDIDNPENPFAVYTAAQNADYIFKFLQQKCYEQKDNPNSVWYGTKHGKPFRLMLVTHWHDGRVAVNESIRNLAKRWGASICPFDEKIGFSRNAPLPNGVQVSTIYARNNQVIDGVTYGWHPEETGESSEYIQQRMADIFAQSVMDSYGRG